MIGGSLALLVVLVYAHHVATAPFVYEDVHLLATTDAATPLPLRPNRSLTDVTFKADRIVYGLSPIGWHATNVVVHVLNGLLVGSLATYLGLPGGIASAAFLLLPIQTEAVAYLNGRGDLLATLWTLLALGWLLCFAEWALIPALACFIAGILSKETAVVFVGLAPLLLWAHKHGATSSEKVFLWICVGIAGLGIPFVFVSQQTSPLTGLPWAATQASAAWTYLVLSFAPFQLSVDHDFERIPMLVRGISLALWLAIPCVAWRLRRIHQDVSLSLAWIWIAVLPRLLVPVPNALMSEHQFYLPCVGVAFLAASVWKEAWGDV